MLSPMRLPGSVTDEILGLCRQLDPTQKPVYVPVRPEPGCAIGECYENVRRKAERCGGRAQLGWNIEIWPNVLLDAQFHSIYCDATAGYIDLTPTQNGASRILFLPDSSRTYSGARILSKRVPLRGDNDIAEYIALTAEKDALEAARFHAGIIDLSGADSEHRRRLNERRAELWHILAFRYAAKNEPCPCGRPVKFKRCCLGR